MNEATTTMRAWRILFAVAIGFMLLGPPTHRADAQEAGVSDVEAAPGNALKNEIRFNTSLVEDVREGYVTLEWNAIDDAQRYEVRDEHDAVAYSGIATKAFLSGLADGKYRYHAFAYDDSGTELASTVAPAVVQVEHWSMKIVATLFVLGLIVVLAVAVVLWVGSRIENGDHKRGHAEVIA